MKAGELRPVHIGRSCRLARAELERYVNRLQAPSPPPPALPTRRRRRPTTDEAACSTLSTPHRTSLDLCGSAVIGEASALRLVGARVATEEPVSEHTEGETVIGSEAARQQ